jgi:altronate dehydratase large subunit
MNFQGYVREDGSVGVRNLVAVIPTVGCVNEAARRIAAGMKRAAAFLHHQGCCQLSPDLVTITRVLAGLGCNPNVGAILLVSLGCESISAEEVGERISPHKPVELVCLQELGGITCTVRQGRRILHSLNRRIRCGRVPVEVSALTVGVKCGASDASSGLAANPAVGHAVDLLVDRGATVLFGETTEVLGAEHVLAKRAANARVGERIIRKVQEMEERVRASGVDMRGGQPTPGNMRGGISTIEEKSLGAIVKGGSSPVRGVLEYGDAPPGQGLYFMDSPGREMEFLTGVAAAGCQIILFTTGMGAPQGFPLAPVLKITGNHRTFLSLEEHMDLDVSGVIQGSETVKQAGERIAAAITAVASGKQVKAEITGYDAAGVNATVYTTGPVI